MRSWRTMLAAAALLTVAVESRASGAIQPGTIAPGFTKTALGGGPTSLSSYAGKVVVLYLFGYS